MLTQPPELSPVHKGLSLSARRAVRASSYPHDCEYNGDEDCDCYENAIKDFVVLLDSLSGGKGVSDGV